MNNTVILNKDASTWPRIKKYREADGHDVSRWDEFKDYQGYFSLGEGIFGFWTLAAINELGLQIIELPEEPKEEKKYPEHPKPILRFAYEIIGRLKAENLKRAGFNDIEISTYLEADKDLKEIEKHLNG